MAAANDTDIAGPPMMKYDGLLSPTTIRLAELLESSDPSRICFNLTTHELSAAPPYVALSYVCGRAYTSFEGRHQVDETPVRNNTVYVNECPVLIYENLYLFLSILVNQKTWGMVWIDVICINQEDAEEKTRQILLMESIYTSAKMVLGWLGPYDTECGAHDFEWMVKTFMPAIARAIHTHGREVVDSLQITHPAFPDFLGVEDPLTKMIGAIRYEARCQYLKRAWTYQEVVQASTVTLMCGYNEFSAAVLCRFVACAIGRGWDGISRIDPLLEVHLRPGEAFSGIRRWRMMIRDESARVPRFEELAQVVVWASTKPGLLSSDPSPGWLSVILRATKGTSCTDPRDSLYSLLGLARRYPISPLSTYIPVDYTYSWEELYRITASAILRKSGSLILLDMVENRPVSSSQDRLPSWVPNYGSTTTYGSVAHTWLWNHHGEAELVFDASSSMKSPMPTFEILEDTLVASGAEIDEIKFVCPHSMEIFFEAMHDITDVVRFLLLLQLPNNSVDSHRVWRTFFLVECRNFSKGLHEGDDEVRADSFRKYMIGKCAESLIGSRVETEDAIHETVLQELGLLYEELTSRVLGSSGWSLEDVMGVYAKYDLARSADNSEARIAQEKMEEYDKETKLFRAAIAPAVQGRRLYITQKNHLVLGLLYGEIGDRVFILRDSRSLQILRPTGTSNKHEYRYVGEAYIDGCMNGQLLQGPESVADQFHEVRIL